MNELLHERYENLKKRQKYFMVDYEELEASINNDEEKKEAEYKFESQYDMEYPTDIWCEQFESTKYDSIIYIYGIGNYMHLKKFIKKVAFDAAVVYEPDIRRFAEFMCEDVEDILAKEDMYFITGEGRYGLLRYTLENFVNYNNSNQLYAANIPNYIKCYDEDYDQYYNIIKTKCDDIVFEKVTKIAHEKVQSYNYLNNVFKLIDEAGIQELIDTLQEYIGYPAVLVSAGPSLDKNVKLLERYKGRAFIIAVDAALNTLRKNGIVPDLMITMDPKFERITALSDDEYNNLPMIVNPISGYKLLNSHVGRKFFDVQQDNLVELLVERASKPLPILGTGGSVANSAFSFLEYAGFKTIILIGQDLAYPNNKAHASGAFENEKDIEAESEKYFYVDDIYGNKVLTEKNMDLYRAWFEETIRNKKELTVIDATEGGALIKGTQIMSLQSALEKYCIYPQVDFVNAMNKAEYLFDDKERNSIKEEITGLYSTVDNAISKLKKGKNLYDKLEDLYFTKKTHTNQFRKINEKIKELNNYIDCDSQMALFGMYAAEERMAVLDDMPDDDCDDVTQQISMLADAGRKMLDAYILAGEKIKENWEKYQNNISVNETKFCVK